MRRAIIVIGLGLALLSGCAATNDGTSSGPASSHLLQLGQLGQPGFVIQQAPQSPSPSLIAGPIGGSTARQLHADGLLDASSTTYIQPTTQIQFANGPVEVVSICSRFAQPSGAKAWYAHLTTSMAKITGTSEASTGPLGDQASAFIRSSLDGTVPAVQIIVVWRSGNLVNEIQDYGRYGGTRLDDAIYLAERQQQNA